MSKTIEIASIHKGPVAVPVRGESRTITFEDKGDVGYAKVDHDEAAVLLKVGLPDFWKPGTPTTTEGIVDAAVAGLDGDAAKAAEDITGRRPRKKKDIDVGDDTPEDAA